MFSVVLVKCRDWVFICEFRVSTVSTKCEIAILQCQHTIYIWAVFLFIGKDIQVFLVFRISAFCSWSCWTGFTHKISIFCHAGTFLLDPELPNVSKFSRDVPTLLHQKMKWSATNFWNRFPTLRQDACWTRPLKGSPGFSPRWRDLSCQSRKKESTNPATKAQACCVTKKCWRAFVCCSEVNRVCISFCCDVTSPHIANIFLGGNANLRLAFGLTCSSFLGGMAGISVPSHVD